ncbi:MAG: hypothetical protein M3Y87_20210, partial [Myxococcota bacterium]|nr:hypothetical protein [Myxococcota bacterium]
VWLARGEGTLDALGSFGEAAAAVALGDADGGVDAGLRAIPDAGAPIVVPAPIDAGLDTAAEDEEQIGPTKRRPTKRRRPARRTGSKRRGGRRR